MRTQVSQVTNSGSGAQSATLIFPTKTRIWGVSITATVLQTGTALNYNYVMLQRRNLANINTPAAPGDFIALLVVPVLGTTNQYYTSSLEFQRWGFDVPANTTLYHVGQGNDAGYTMWSQMILTLE